MVRIPLLRQENGTEAGGMLVSLRLLKFFLVLQGIHHYRTYFSFSRGLSQMEVSGEVAPADPGAP